MITPSLTDAAPSVLPAAVGIVVQQLADPGQQKIMASITRQLNRRGAISVLLNADTPATLRDLVRQAAPLGLRGLLVLSGCGQRLDLSADLNPVPVLQISAEPEAEADALQAGTAMADLLLAQGHQRFGFMQNRPGASAQKQGFSAGIQKAGRSLDAELIAEGGERDCAYRAMIGYLKRTRAAERIQALFCESDVLAFGAMQAIRDFGQGVHLAVTGFGDVEEANSSTWHLTSWSPDTGRIISRALDRWLGVQAGSHAEEELAGLHRRHSHFGKVQPGEMSACGCAFRH